jgi:hypothetical protein
LIAPWSRASVDRVKCSNLSLVALGVGLAAGCGGKKDQGGRYELVVKGASPGAAILVSGKPVGVLDKDRKVEITLPPGVFLRDGKGAVGVRLDTPCGPKDVTFAMDPINFDVEKGERTMAKAIFTPVDLPKSIVMHTFWVDRTGAPAAKVTIGSSELRKDMERHNRIELVWPTCEEGHVVRVDGTEIGKLPAQEPTEQELVIATKPTCYRLREVIYTPGTYGKGDDDKVFARTQMVWSKPITYFLERAPDEISSSEVAETRRELMAIECSKGK